MSSVFPTEAQRRTPKYQQVYETLRTELRGGESDPARPLGTELELAARFRVSRVTVRRALDLLEEQGLIVRRRRLGTFPAKRTVPVGRVHNIDQLTKETEWLAENSEIRVLSCRKIRAPRPVREALELAPANGSVVQFNRVRLDRDGTIAHLASYLPESIGSKLTRAELVRTPPLVLLGRKGVKIRTTRQTVSATLADDEMAGALEIEPGAPLLLTTRLLIGATNQPVSYTISHMRGDRYELRYTLGKRGSSGAPAVWRTFGAADGGTARTD